MKLPFVKQYIALTHDVLMALFSFIFALYLRLGENFYSYSEGFLWQSVVVFTSISVLIFLLFRTHQSSWRFVSQGDLLVIIKAVTLILLFFPLCMFIVNRLEDFPRSVIVINWFVLITLLGGSRVLYRMYRNRSLAITLEKMPAHQTIPVLLLGADPHTEAFLRSISTNNNNPYRAIGILDSERGMKHRNIRGIKVLGDIEELKTIMNQLQQAENTPQKILISPEIREGKLLRAITETAEHFGVSLSRLPRITELKEGVVEKPELTPIAVEDLLGRPQTPLKRERIERALKGKAILITGAGGTIGSELVRQIANLSPASITLVEHSEHALYQIDKELEENHPTLPRKASLVDIRNAQELELAFSFHSPELVFHAAALKHVPMSEQNVCAAIATNIGGTMNVANAAIKYKAKKMVLISTDKAVNPTSVMGATKRAAELLLTLLRSENKRSITRFSAVRFGNVLGSTGSVVPLFKRQLSQGGPLTVTHKEMTRYFMTVREAVELVLHASTLDEGIDNSSPPLFVLDMRDPVKIDDLARQVIRLAGLKPDVDIAIEYVGLRPGEKMHEELFYHFESAVPSSIPGISFAQSLRESTALRTLKKCIERSLTASHKLDTEKALESLKEIVPEFKA